MNIKQIKATVYGALADYLYDNSEYFGTSQKFGEFDPEDKHFLESFEYKLVDQITDKDLLEILKFCGYTDKKLDLVCEDIDMMLFGEMGAIDDFVHRIFESIPETEYLSKKQIAEMNDFRADANWW